MNRNVVTWLTGQVPSARHAVILTHNINFLFVQSILLPKLRAAGNPRVTIFADAACAGSAWRQDRALLSGLGVQYRVVPVDLGPWRRFHPKALLLADRARGALAIGSGNLTQGGMGSNREAWAFGTSEDDGAPRLAAFRTYLARLIDTLPLPESLREGMGAIFNPDHSWVARLPSAGGLVTAPSSPSILEQLAAVAGDVRAVTVLAPYYDDRGEALGEIARRFQAPVMALLQPGRVGLWAGAAKGLPAGVKLKSAQVPGEKPPFIHAKVLALHRANDVLLAVGSANCSRAALLSDDDEGNAELMAWEIVEPGVVDSLLAELSVTDEAPELPPERVSEDWPEEQRASLRILAARQEADDLEIAFSTSAPIREMFVLAEGDWPVRELDPASGIARLSTHLRLRTITLRAVLADGTVVESPEAWVDDEVSLSASASLRRVLKRLADTEEPDAEAARGYQAVLEIFNEYLHDPEAGRRHARHREGDGLPTAYDPAAVFDDGFGKAGLPAARGTTVSAQAPASALSIIEMLFNIGPGTAGYRPPSASPAELDEGGDESESEAPDDQLPPPARPAADPRIAASVRRAVERIEKALLDPQFVEARAPSLLGADLGLAAILLVMGISGGHVEVGTFRETTRRLWEGLFFGRNGRLGTILARLSAQENQNSFLVEFATPRLAAVLSLWCVTEWSAGDADGLWFRLSAARLQASCPFLFAAANPDAMIAELQIISASLLPRNEQAACARTWRDVIRAGKALELLCGSLKRGSREKFRQIGTNTWLEPATLVWAGHSLAYPTVRTRHEASANICIRPLGVEKKARFKGGFVFPVQRLLDANVLDLPSTALPEVLRFVADAERAGSQEHCQTNRR